MGEGDRSTVSGRRVIIMHGEEPTGISREEERWARRVLKENKIYGHLPRTTPKWPSVNVRAVLAARKSTRCKPMVQILNPVVIIEEAPTAPPKPEGSFLKLPRDDLGESSAGSKAEVEVGSVFKCSSADASTTDEVMEGSVLKPPCVDAGEAMRIVVGNLVLKPPCAASANN